MLKKKIQIALFTRYDSIGASSRLRSFQFLPALQQQFNIEVFPLFGDEYLLKIYNGKPSSKTYIFKRYLQRLGQLLKASKYELVWIEKELFPYLPHWAEGLLSMVKKTYIVDYDDAIFHNYDLSKNPFIRLLSNKIDKVMHNAATVTAGNAYIADRALKAGAKCVEIIPTVIDINRYTVKEDATHKHKSLVIGWIGSPSTAKYLRNVIPSIKELVQKYDLTLRVIGAEIEDTNIDVVCVPWSEESEVPEIKKFDIGIMPLTDSPWERGKCGYKLIQYMACGLPVIASPVGVNAEIVEHGVNGFLVETHEEWVLALQTLINDPDLRLRMGKAGREKVKRQYSLQVTCPVLASIIKSVVQGS